MKALNQKIIILAVLILANVSFAGTYSGGSGTELLPYQIGSLGNWQELMATSTDWDKHFILINDINLADYTGTEFEFNIIEEFTGVFDGNDYKILSFTLSGISPWRRPELFWYVGESGQRKV